MQCHYPFITPGKLDGHIVSQPWKHLIAMKVSHIYVRKHLIAMEVSSKCGRKHVCVQKETK